MKSRPIFSTSCWSGVGDKNNTRRPTCCGRGTARFPERKCPNDRNWREAGVCKRLLLAQCGHRRNSAPATFPLFVSNQLRTNN